MRCIHRPIPRPAACLVASIGLLAAATGALAEDHLKLAVGGQRGVGETFAADVGQQSGIFKKHGLDLNVLYTESSGETLQAVISGSVQIGVATGFTGTIGVFAKGAPVRIIGSSFTGGSQLFWYVRADSSIRSVQDTAGRTVAYSSSGSSAHTSVLALRKFSGVDFTPTVTGSAPTTLTMVMSGQVDVGWSGAPFAVEQIEKGDIRMVWKASAAPVMEKQTIRVMVANATELKQHHEVYVRFMRAYRETQDWVYSTPEGLKAYAAWARLSEPAARRALDEFIPRIAVDPDRISGLDDVLADAVTFKYIPALLTKEQVNELIQIPERKNSP